MHFRVTRDYRSSQKIHTRVTGSRHLIFKVTLMVTADFSLNTGMHFRVTRGYRSRQKIHTRVTGRDKKTCEVVF